MSAQLVLSSFVFAAAAFSEKVTQRAATKAFERLIEVGRKFVRSPRSPRRVRSRWRRQCAKALALDSFDLLKRDA
jgi:hypothetical protein